MSLARCRNLGELHKDMRGGNIRGSSNEALAFWYRVYMGAVRNLCSKDCPCETGIAKGANVTNEAHKQGGSPRRKTSQLMPTLVTVEAHH